MVDGERALGFGDVETDLPRTGGRERHGGLVLARSVGLRERHRRRLGAVGRDRHGGGRHVRHRLTVVLVHHAHPVVDGTGLLLGRHHAERGLRTVRGGGRGESDRDGEQEERCGQEGEAAHVVTVIGGTAR